MSLQKHCQLFHKNSIIFVKNKYDNFVIKQQLFMQNKVRPFHKKGDRFYQKVCSFLKKD